MYQNRSRITHDPSDEGRGITLLTITYLRKNIHNSPTPGSTKISSTIEITLASSKALL